MLRSLLAGLRGYAATGKALCGGKALKVRLSTAIQTKAQQEMRGGDLKMVGTKRKVPTLLGYKV